MMHEIELYGEGDSTVQVEGDVERTFDVDGSELYLGIGATEITAQYDGVWTFDVVKEHGNDDVYTHAAGRPGVVREVGEGTEAVVIETDHDVVESI